MISLCDLCIPQVESLEFLCSGELTTEDNRTYLNSDINGVKDKSAIVFQNQSIHVFTKVNYLQNIYQ